MRGRTDARDGGSRRGRGTADGFQPATQTAKELYKVPPPKESPSFFPATDEKPQTISSMPITPEQLQPSIASGSKQADVAVRSSGAEINDLYNKMLKFQASAPDGSHLSSLISPELK